MNKLLRRGTWRAGFLWFAMLTSCYYPLVRTPPHPFVPDIPGAKRFPDGTRGMVVVRDTLWVGAIRWSPDALVVDRKAFPIGNIRCLAYRFPPSYRPPSLESDASLGAVLGGIFTVLPWTSSSARCDPSSDPGCGLFRPILYSVVVSASLASLLLAMYSLSYPTRRVQHGLYRYALSSDPLDQARCAEILHFYDPLLDSTGTFVISLK